MNQSGDKPLFVPLKREWFEAFERGDKRQEIRRYGSHYNERTCRIGRAAILRLGYSGREMRARIVGFAREMRDNDIYGPAADCAVITLTMEARPMPDDRTTPELDRLLAALRALDWDAAELAYRLQVNTSTVKSILNGRRPVHPNLLAWAEAWAAAVAPLPQFPDGWTVQAKRPRGSTSRASEDEG